MRLTGSRAMADDTPPGPRHSMAQTPVLITDETQRALRESENGLRQTGVLYGMIDEWLQPERKFRLRPSALLALQRAAVDGLSAYAGNYRPGGVEIHGSKHAPPGAHLVPHLVEEMCDYVNDNWDRGTAIHLAAYVMWRLNWIHPFDDGNGRTSRAVSYLVMCLRLGYRPPGQPTIPEMIKRHQTPYYEALEKADVSVTADGFDLSAMEELLTGHLASQLMTVVTAASARTFD